MKMRDSLQKIAAVMDEILAADFFPEAVQPAWLAQAVRDYPSRGGKRLRPALVIWCCELLGGEARRALYPAAALEVNHNWTLVHDDIIDQDDFRRNQPTCHVQLTREMAAHFGWTGEDGARMGRNFAILAGDVQQAWAQDLMLRSVESGVAPATAVALARRLALLGNRELVSGEALDVALSMRPVETIAPAEVLTMIEGKTGALLQLAAEVGAMVALDTADATQEPVRKLGEFAKLCGVAFQLRDDYLGIFGEEAKLGKPLGNDLREAKPTLLLLKSLTRCGAAERRELQGFLHRSGYSEADLRRVRYLMQSCGAADEVAAEAAALSERALALLHEFPDCPARHCLEELVAYLTRRDL